MTAGRRILRNFFNLSAGELVARLVNFAAFAHLARALGSTEFGVIGFLLTVASYLLIPVMQGFDSVGIRDVAREHSRLRDYAGTILLIRLLSALLTLTALAAATVLTEPAPPMGRLLLLFGLLLFPNALSLKWAFQAMEDTRPVAVAGIVAQLAFAGGAFFIRGPEQLARVPLYLLIGETSGMLLLAVTFVIRFGWFRPVLDAPFWKDLFRESAPLTASTVVGTLLYNFDVLALARFQSTAAVGLYTAVYKLLLVFSTLLTLFQLSVFPALARAYRDRQELGPVAFQVVRLVLAAFLPLAFAGLFLARPLIGLLFGAEYVAGAATLKILLWALPFMALRSVFRIILVSHNLQRLDLRAVTAGAVTNVLFDLILAPGLSTVGTAISTFLSEFVICYWSYRYVWRHVEPIYALRHFTRPVMACVPMLPIALAPIPPVVQAITAAILYYALLKSLRGFEWKEIAALLR